MSRITTTLSTLALVLATAACTEVTPVDDGAAGEPRVLARVDGKHGHVTFLADGAGGVAISEVSDRGTGDAELLIEAEHATALEAFLALAPADQAVPDELVAQHHEQVGDAAPRALAVPLAGTVDYIFNDCTSGAWTPWHNATTALYSGRSSSFYTTAGDIFFTGYINGQYKRRFDACGGAGVPLEGLTAVIARRNGGAWSSLPWEKFHANQHFYFTSLGGTYPDWRMTVSLPASGGVRSYGVGGAWNPSGVITGG